MKTLVLTDNGRALCFARELAQKHGEVDIFQSPTGQLGDVPRLDVRAPHFRISDGYDLIISIHCKQLFPAELLSAVRCVNVHPGYNPFNRGWYPQVFSILNGMKAGVTIHEMDERLDHGPIIVQREYAIKSWDTSESAYENIMQIEQELLFEHFVSIRDGTYTAWNADFDGNLNFRRDFDRLRQIDLRRSGSFGEFLNLIRALTHGDYRNAFFIDENGQRVFVRLILEHEDDAATSS